MLSAQAADDRFWEFAPANDSFDSKAMLDLRYLNERTAGESGFVKSGNDGHFLLGNGKPVRFWAVNTEVGRKRVHVVRPLWKNAPPDLAKHARFLAKRGVNMVRLHTHINPEPEQALMDINEDERDWIWRTVAAMKKEGIYTTISPYWAETTKLGEKWRIPGGANQNASGLLFFDETLQRAYKSWLHELLTVKNPYTGIPLAQDTSVAIIQIQNEDSLLFWTVNRIAGAQRRNLQHLFGAWAGKKYGSPRAALAAWRNTRLLDDRPDDGRLDFFNLSAMTKTSAGGRALRINDQLQFWSETMRNFNTDIGKYLREELGCRQLINAGNWRTADSERLFDAERWSYLANDVVAVNRYFDGVHVGSDNGWAIRSGDEFTSPSALEHPTELPINMKQVAGHPSIVPEGSWVMPNRNGAEGPFLIAAYQSLTGVDAFYWFTTHTEQWTPPRSANGYLPSQQKWIFAIPEVLGTFPAAALVYRRGYVKRGNPAVYEERSMEDIWQRKSPLIYEEGGFDPNRDSGHLPSRSITGKGVPHEAFLVGPVIVKYGGDAKNNRVQDLSAYVNSAKKTIASNTGEILLDAALGYAIVNAPKVQGVAAHFDRREHFETEDASISSQNSFGSVLLVAMDDRPLRVSNKVLVQVGTRARPSGWKEVPTTISIEEGKFNGFRIENYGRAPWLVASAKLQITLRNLKLRHASVLDMNGNVVSTTVLQRNANGISLNFPDKAMYVVLN